MSEIRRDGGRETWNRLREWDKGQADSERLSAGLIALEGFHAIDPSHPIGGPDGGKDILCARDGAMHIVGVYFPRGQQSFSKIKTKFTEDLENALSNKAEAFVFVTNQELKLKERAELEDLAAPTPSIIFHLERVATILNNVAGYALRLEFLQIPMTVEEQLAFINDRDERYIELFERLQKADKRVAKSNGIVDVKVETDAWNPYSAVSIPDPNRPRLMECKSCEEIFRAVPAEPWYFGIGYSGLSTVSCPACGKVQRFTK